MSTPHAQLVVAPLEKSPSMALAAKAVLYVELWVAFSGSIELNSVNFDIYSRVKGDIIMDVNVINNVGDLSMKSENE